MCQPQQQRLLKDQRGFVYCNGKASRERLTTALSCSYYHAEVPSRAEQLDRWLETGGLIVATSSLGTRLDSPEMVFILHVVIPWSMIDFAQESGRGGRGGERVESMILVEMGTVERRMKEEREKIDIQAMGLFLLGSGCRRDLMSSYLDRKRVSCRNIESAGCDRCREGLPV